MADQAKEKGIAPKRASNPADLGQSSRPIPPIQTLLEDKEDGEDYSEVIEVLKQHIKSNKRVIASQSSDIKTLLLSLNTLKASVEDSPYLGPAIDNTATSNLDPPIDTGSKEGFKDTITSSIVKELSKKAYTIPDDSKLSGESNFKQWIQALTVLLMLLRNSLSSSPRAAISRPIESKKEDVYNEFHALTFSTYRKGLSAFNAEFNSYLAKLTMAKIDIDPSLILNQNPAIEAYRAAHVANSSNSTSNSNSNPSKKGKNKKKGSYNLAIEEEEESDSSSNSSSSSDSNTQLAQLLALKGYKKRKDFKGKGLKTSSNKAKYKDNQPRRRPKDPALYNSWLYDTGSMDHISNSKERFTTFTPNTGQLRPINTRNSSVSLAGIGSIILEVLSRKAPPTYTKLVLDNVLYLPNIDINIRNKIVVEIPSNSIRKEDYRPIIEDAIVSEAIEPNKRYKLRNSPAKGTTLEGIGPSLRGKRPFIEGNKVEKAISSPTLKEPNIGYIGLRLLKKTSSITKGLPNFDKIKEADFHCSGYDRGKAVRRVSKALIPDPRKVLDSIEGDTVKIRPRPYNRNPIVLLLVDCKSRYRWVFNLPNKSGPIVANAIKGFFRGLRNGFGRYPTKFHFDGGTEITDLLTTWLAKRGIKFSTSAPYIHKQNGLVERSLRVILDFNSTAITNKETTPFQALFDKLEPGIPYIPNLERYRAIGAGGQAIIPLEKRSKSLKFTSRTEEYKLLAPTDNTALEGELVDLDLDLKGAVSPDPSNLNTEKPISIEIEPSKLEPYESSSNKPIFIPKPIEVIAPNQPLTNKPLDNSDFISKGDKMQLDYYKLLAKTSSYILSFVYKARKRVISKDSTPTTYKQVLKLPRDERTSNKAIYKLLLKYGYSPSTPNIIKLSKALYSLKQSPREWQDKLKILYKSLGYLPLISDPGKRLNKVYAIEDLGPAAYFLGYLNSTKDYSICFSYNGNIVADLGPKLSNSSNITTKLGRDFHSKEGPRPLTTTSTTIVDSRNGKGSSRTSIINSSLVPIGFSNSDFTGDKATSKSTYGYLYKLAGRPISWKTKRATTIALSTLEAETDGLTEAIRKVQWIIGLFSELYRPIDYPITLYRDNQGSITVANDPALYARTKYTLLKFQDVREQVKAKIVTIIYLNTKFNR
ncbi:hypothetical protein P8C59_000134 [Phyllachora maydis]|uniref:Integrase catalytic domain-containing protein n=1 Tax=Phyllachora maydis TaxID=1825666 RepID=A0AAD9HWD9_9PEZI|nr:hypothetical protein P8C59_000134 [Phyllachora maydis]